MKAEVVGDGLLVYRQLVGYGRVYLVSCHLFRRKPKIDRGVDPTRAAFLTDPATVLRRGKPHRGL